MNYIVACLGLALLSLATYSAVRIARADADARADSPESLARAVRLAPGDAEYRLRLAILLEAAGRDAGAPLDAAAALNPASAAAWMRQGLHAEMRGDLPNAERCLLRAAQLSLQYEPRWTLANYYFRHGRTEDFWRWTRLALAMSYGDRKPLFDLCWNVSQNDATVLTRALPDRLPVWQDYLAYLLAEKRLDAVPPVAARILSEAGPAAVPLLLDADTALLDAGRPQPALDTWNGLCRRRLLPHAPLAPDRGLSLTNGDFRLPFAAGGFDWRVPPVSGIAAVRGQSLFRAAFSGKQPESCEILWQLLPLEPNRRYTLSYEYRTEDIAPAAGLRWQILDAASPDLSSPAWKREQVTFDSRGARLARLVLLYRRAPGTTRIEGALSLRSVALEFQP